MNISESSGKVCQYVVTVRLLSYRYNRETAPLNPKKRRDRDEKERKHQQKEKQHAPREDQIHRGFPERCGSAVSVGNLYANQRGIRVGADDSVRPNHRAAAGRGNAASDADAGSCCEEGRNRDRTRRAESRRDARRGSAQGECRGRTAAYAD